MLRRVWTHNCDKKTELNDTNSTSQAPCHSPFLLATCSNSARYPLSQQVQRPPLRTGAAFLARLRKQLKRALHLRGGRNGVSSIAELVCDHFVDVKVHLPVMIGMIVAAHREQGSFRSEFRNFNFGDRCGQ